LPARPEQTPAFRLVADETLGFFAAHLA